MQIEVDFVCASVVLEIQLGKDAFAVQIVLDQPQGLSVNDQVNRRSPEQERLEEPLVIVFPVIAERAGDRRHRENFVGAPNDVVERLRRKQISQHDETMFMQIGDRRLTRVGLVFYIEYVARPVFH